MIAIGELSLWVALILASWSAAVSFTGATLGRRDLVLSGERAIYMTLLMILLACAGLWVALFAHDFSITHAAAFSTRNLPSLFLVSAMWAGRAGGLLFCALSLAIVASLVVLTGQSQARLTRVTGILAAALALLLVALCLVVNPFARLDWIPQEGQGMPPGLQNVWTSLYHPVLYAGAASLAAPIALWIDARLSRQVDIERSDRIRMWSLLPWIMTTAAVMLGIRQAYTIIDPQASWLYHPIRSGSLVPWLFLIGFIAPRLSLRATRLRSTRIGAYVAIPGLLLIIAAIAGHGMREVSGLTLTPGSTAQILDPFGKRWTLENLGVSRYDVLNRQVTAIALDVSIDGEAAGIVTSEMRQHIDSRGAPSHRPSTAAGVRGTWPLDLVVSLDDVDAGEAARLRVAFNPLVRVLWIGGIFILLGGGLFIYPKSRTRA